MTTQVLLLAILSNWADTWAFAMAVPAEVWPLKEQWQNVQLHTEHLHLLKVAVVFNWLSHNRRFRSRFYSKRFPRLSHRDTNEKGVAGVNTWGPARWIIKAFHNKSLDRCERRFTPETQTACPTVQSHSLQLMALATFSNSQLSECRFSKACLDLSKGWNVRCDHTGSDLFVLLCNTSQQKAISS